MHFTANSNTDKELTIMVSSYKYFIFSFNLQLILLSYGANSQYTQMPNEHLHGIPPQNFLSIQKEINDLLLYLLPVNSLSDRQHSLPSCGSKKLGCNFRLVPFHPSVILTLYPLVIQNCLQFK